MQCCISQAMRSCRMIHASASWESCGAAARQEVVAHVWWQARRVATPVRRHCGSGCTTTVKGGVAVGVCLLLQVGAIGPIAAGGMASCRPVVLLRGFSTLAIVGWERRYTM
jgi:hypothetical protein